MNIQDPEAELLTRVAAGDRTAFSELYALMSPRVFGLVLRVVRDRHHAEEVTQEVFLEVWRSAARYEATLGSASGWMLRIAHSRAVDRVRAAVAASSRDLRVGIRDFDVVESPEDSVAFRLDNEAVGRALAALTEAQRTAILLTHLDGYTQAEAAEILHIPLGTVKTRVREGMMRLRRQLVAA